MLRNRKPISPIPGALKGHIVAFPKKPCPSATKQVPSPDFQRIRLALPLTVIEVAWVLHTSPDRVRRIPRAELPYMNSGAGPWALYDLQDVIQYVRTKVREQSGELDFKDRRELITEFLGSARGRSSQPRGTS